MIPILYDKTGEQKLGELINCIKCLVEEERNGLFELTVIYPNNDEMLDFLEKENIIVVDANDYLKSQKFRIYKTRKLMSNRIEINARHISFDLAYDYVENISITNQPCEYVLNTLFRNSQFSQHYRGYSNIIMASDYSQEKVNLIEAIGGTSGSIVDTYGTGAEILRDNTNIHVLNRRGHDNEVTIEYRKNLTGLTVEEDTTELVTRIIPFATVTDEHGIETEVKGDFVDSPYIGNYSHPYVKYVDYSEEFDDENVPTKEKLKTLALKEYTTKKADLPKLNYKIEFIPLSKCAGYEGLEDRINLCDTITVRDTRYNVDTTAKVIKVVYNVLRNRYDSMELGEPKTSLGDVIGGSSDSNRGPIGPQGPQGPQGPAGANGNIEDFPDTLPTTPVITTKLYGFASIEVSWTFENKLYYSYELYASKTKGFTPNTANLLFSGQASTFLHQVKPKETWYYRVCAVNSHGNRTAFSEEKTVNTVKVADLSSYVENQAIGDALIGTLSLDRGWVGELHGNYIDAKQLSVTNGNGSRTLDIDAYGNVALDVAELKINAKDVITEEETDNKVNSAKTELNTAISKKANSVDVYKKSETYTKNETDSAISVAKDEINLSVSGTYETKTNVESKISASKTEVINTSKSYADTKKTEAITQAGKDADNKVASAKTELNTAINKKANTVDVYKKTETYTKSETDSKIKVAKDEITLGVSNTYETKANVETKVNQSKTEVKNYADSKINSIEVGGRNLLRNTDFTSISFPYGTAPYNWRTASTSATNVTRVKHSITDNNAFPNSIGGIKITKTGTDSLPCDIAQDSVKMEDGQTYTMSFYARLESGSGKAKLQYGTSPYYSELTTLTTSWTKYAYTFTYDKSKFSSKLITNIYFGIEGATFVGYICGLKLEKGNKVTEWTPAPEDINSAIDTTKNELNTAINKKANTTDVYKKSETYTKSETDSKIKIAKDEINLGVSSTYETKTNVETKISSSKTEAINTSKSYADTKKAEAISTASTDATNKVNSAKTELNTAINKKANSTDVYKKTETYTKSETDSKVNVAKDSITQSVANTYETKSESTTKYNTATAIAKAMNEGKVIHTDIAFRTGSNNVGTYNNTGNGNVVVERIGKPSDCPTTSTHCLRITHKGVASPGLGGFYQTIQSRANAIFIQKFVAMLPSGYTLNTASNSMGSGYSDKWLTSNKGTGKWETYIRQVTCGSTGTFSNGGHVYVTGTTPTTATPLVWYLASCTAIDITDTDERVTDLTSRVSKAEQKITDSAIISTVQNTINAAKTEAINSANSNTANQLKNYSTTSQMNSAISQKANEITSSVSKTYATKGEVSNTYSTKSELSQTVTDFTFKLQNSGGYNVIKNGNALNGSAFWNPYWLPSASWGVRNDEWSGYVPCFQINNPAGSYHENCIYQNVPTTIGKTYTVSAMVAGHRGNNHISVVNGGGTYVICNSNNAWDRYGGSDAKDWTICTATFVAPESTTQIRLVCSPIAGTANNYGWFKEVQVEEGTQRTNYTPNPAEVYTGITRIDNEGVHVSHSLDGSTSHMGAHGFTHYVGGTNRKYHSLMVAGSVSTTDSWGQISMRITLPSEFRGKTFEVLPSLVHVGFDRDIAHAFKNLNISVHDFNHATGQFTLTCNPIGVDVVGAWAVNASTVRVSYIAIA